MLTCKERVLCRNPLQRFGSVLEPDPEPTREFEPVAITTYHMVSEWRPVLPLGEMLLAGDSPNPQAKPFARKAL